ncbi:MAG: ankyrin repeat domain-containing protein, partial [Treponema sp.]|nr:ankyrin repeat domain-containing protein [Treponema sp.]
SEKILELVESAPVKKIKKFIIRNGHLANEKYGEKENSLLIEALEKGRDYDVIKLLLDAGVNPKAQNADGDTAVSYAAKKNADAKILDALISYDTVLPFQRKNRILKKNDEGMSAVDYAEKNANPEQMKTIRHYLGIVDVAEAPAESPAAPAEEKTPQAPESLTPAPAAPEPAPEPAPEAPVEQAVESVAEAAVGISAPADALALQEAAAAAAARAANPHKRIYLFEGIEAYDTYDQKEEEKEQLIAEPDKKGQNGRSLLQKAASEDDLKMIRLLIDSKATINLTDNEGYTALMYAARFAKKVETVALLLSAGADAKIKNRFGLTALEIAASDNKNPEIIGALIVKTPKTSAQKAYVAAVGLGRPNSIIEKFIANGMNVNAYYKGKSVLMYAAESNTHTNCIKFLLEKGADKSMLSSEWKDAFYYASKNPSLPKNDVYWSLNNSEKKQ